MKTKIVANTVVFQSRVPLEALRILERFQPGALTVCDTEKRPIMTATAARDGSKGSITRNRIVFDPEADSSGLAVLTITLPFGEIADKKQYIAENYGAAIMAMNELEEMILNSVSALERQIGAVRNEIEEV